MMCPGGGLNTSDVIMAIGRWILCRAQSIGFQNPIHMHPDTLRNFDSDSKHACTHEKLPEAFILQQHDVERSIR